jgi:hypothetical protein
MSVKLMGREVEKGRDLRKTNFGGAQRKTLNRMLPTTAHALLVNLTFTPYSQKREV